jgi:hypothetical protein
MVNLGAKRVVPAGTYFPAIVTPPSGMIRPGPVGIGGQSLRVSIMKLLRIGSFMRAVKSATELMV